MPAYLNDTLTPAQAPAWTDPYERQRAELQARMQQQPAPMFTEEEARRRVAQNAREYQLGLLAQMSGDEALAPVGGMVLKNALANRQQRVSERGTADPLTGKFTYSPEYLNAQRQAQLDRLDTGSAASRERFDRDEREGKRDAEARRERAEYARQLKAMSGGGSGMGVGGSQVGVGDDGGMVFRDKGGRLFTYGEDGAPKPYAGKLSPKPSSANPTEDERKAAGWVAQAEFAMKNAEEAIAAEPGAAAIGWGERAAGFVPGIGEDLANVARSPARQRFVQASRSFAEAALRAATGAGVNIEEARQKVAELTPQIGDGKDAIAQKKEAWNVYLGSLKARAGRALPGGSGPNGATGNWGPPGGDASDPLGIRKPGG